MPDMDSFAYLETHAKRLYSSAKDPAMEAARALLDRIKKGDLQDGLRLAMFIENNGLI